MIYFSLIEIFLVSNGIEGKTANKILEILYLNSKPNLLKNILIKVVNNDELTLDEKNMIEKIEKHFDEKNMEEKDGSYKK